jgi:hypothetical protein
MNIEPGRGKSDELAEIKAQRDIIEMIRKHGVDPYHRRTFRKSVIERMVADGWPEDQVQADLRRWFAEAGVEYPEDED